MEINRENQVPIPPLREAANLEAGPAPGRLSPREGSSRAGSSRAGSSRAGSSSAGSSMAGSSSAESPRTPSPRSSPPVKRSSQTNSPRAESNASLGSLSLSSSSRSASPDKQAPLHPLATAVAHSGGPSEPSPRNSNNSSSRRSSSGISSSAGSSHGGKKIKFPRNKLRACTRTTEKHQGCRLSLLSQCGDASCPCTKGCENPSCEICAGPRYYLRPQSSAGGSPRPRPPSQAPPPSEIAVNAIRPIIRRTAVEAAPPSEGGEEETLARTRSGGGGGGGSKVKKVEFGPTAVIPVSDEIRLPPRIRTSLEQRDVDAHVGPRSRVCSTAQRLAKSCCRIT